MSSHQEHTRGCIPFQICHTLLRNFSAFLSGIHQRIWDVSNSNCTIRPWIGCLDFFPLNFVVLSNWILTKADTLRWRNQLHDEQEQHRSWCVPPAGDQGDVIGDVSSHPSCLMIAGRHRVWSMVWRMGLHIGGSTRLTNSEGFFCSDK